MQSDFLSIPGHSHPEEQMGYVIKGRIAFFVGDPEVRHEFTATTGVRGGSEKSVANSK